MDPRELLSALSHPSAFPVAGPDVRVIQTHISMVFLTGERVYKVKKPVSFWGLVDYRTLELRRFYCDEEVRLGRRFAPEIYLGVLPVVRDRAGRVRVAADEGVSAGNDTETIDYSVVMWRYPEGSTLEDRIRAGTAVRDDVVAIARSLASIHDEAPHDASVAREGRPELFEGVIHANLEGTKAAVPSIFPAALHGALVTRLDARLAAARPTLDRRARDLRLVEGHGDLRAEHMVFIERNGRGVWRLIDCLEFSRSFRSIDPLSDVAFLAMDLAFQGRRDLARALFDAYLERRPDADAAELLPLFLAYRALVRSAVDARVAADANVGEEARTKAKRSAMRHWVQTMAYAFAGDRPMLLLTAGPSGVGKSAVAHELAPILDAEVFSSDAVRKELAGVAPTARTTGAARDELYCADMSRRTYGEIVARADQVLGKGGAAILDATFLRRDQRERAYAVARSHHARVVLLWGSASIELVRERIAARASAGADASDATMDVHVKQLTEVEPPQADEGAAIVPFDAADDVGAVLTPIARVLWTEGGPT